MARRTDDQQPDLFSFEGTDDASDRMDAASGTRRVPQLAGSSPDWTPQQKRRHLNDLTARLDRMAAQMADDLAASAIQQWTQRHGAHPDYLTTVRLRETALQNARETVVRQELYDQIEEPPEQTVAFNPPLPQPVPASQVPWNLRWNDARYRSEPGSRSRPWPRWCGRTRSSRSCSASRRPTC